MTGPRAYTQAFALKWLSDDDALFVSSPTNGAGFIAFHDIAQKRGACLLVTGETKLASLEAFAQSCRSLKGLTIKILLPHGLSRSVFAIFENAGLKVEKNKTISDESWEIYFHAQSGRLRFAQAPDSKNPVAKVVVNRTADIRPLITPKPVRQRAKVLIVDDSKTMRVLLRKVIEAHSSLEVMAEAASPSEALKILATQTPDVMTLDINMPEMSGVELLRKVLQTKFIPTIMISSLSINEGNEVLTAFEVGAIDYIQKPAADEIVTAGPIIQEKILAARDVRKQQAHRSTGRLLSGRIDTSAFLAIGASTGGTEAIKSLFLQFPENVPPIAVVQHIPAYFSTAFAERLNSLCRFEVREAKDGDEFMPGLALIAPGGRHMEVVKRGPKFFAKLTDAPPVNRFRPSVDVMFKSVVKSVGSKAVGVLMTGMGDDGARGLLEMRQAGSHTIAQSEQSCVVYGMPRAAVEMGAAVETLDLDQIGEAALLRKAA